MAGKTEGLGETLTRHYRLSCELFNTFPHPQVTLQLSRGFLELHLDSIDLDHLEALCHTIKNKVSPTHLRIHVPTGGKEVVAAKVVERAVEGVAVCVVASLTVTSLGLEGVRLRGRTLKLLCEGVRKARTLKTLHLGKCILGDSGAESVCQAVKNVPSITHLSLVDCGLAERGATAIACLIKHQRLNRDSAMWQDTLRQRRPFLDGMKGLRRLTLNSNPALGDQGAAAIAEVLSEDLWIKAVDLQHCGLGVGGGASLCAALRVNQALEVVDVRNNPFMPDKVLGELAGLLQGRQTEDEAQYSWLKTSQVEDKEAYQQERGRNTVSYRASGRALKGKRAQKSPRVPTSARRPRVPAQLGVPWRVEHRLYERREGLEPGSMVKEHFGEQPQPSVGDAASQPPRASASEGEVTVMKIRRKLQHYRGKYHKEREQRRRLERKLSRIQTQLKGLHTLDEATITHIEECFVKFQVFLSMMQNSGEHLQTSSSSGAASPAPQPPEPSTSFHLPPGMNTLPPGAFFPNLPFGIPVPVFLQQPAREAASQSQEITPKSQPVPAPPSASVEGRHNGTNNTISDRKALREATVNLNPSIADTRNPVASPGHSFRGSKSEMPKDGRPDLARVASRQYRNDPPGFALNGRDNRDEETMKEEETSEEEMMHNQMNKGKEIIRVSNTEKSYPSPIHSSSRPVKQKQTVGTQVTNGILESEVAEVKSPRNQEMGSSTVNVDNVAMRVEVGDLKEEISRAGKTMDVDDKESHYVKENGDSEMSVQSINHVLKMSEITKKERDGNETHHIEENREREMRFQSINYALKTSEMIKDERHPRKDQRRFKNNSSEEIKPAQEDSLSSPLRSPGSEANQSLQDIQLLQEIQLIHSAKSSHHSQSSQSVHTSRSYSSQPPYEIQFVGESPLPRHSSSSPRKSLPLVRYHQESQSPRSRSPYSQSPHSRSPKSQSPQSSSPHSQSPQNHSPRSPPPHSQFPHSQSPHSHIHSPSNQQPQETHSPKRNQSLSPLTKPPQSPHSQSPSSPQQPQDTHSPKRSHLNQSHPTLRSQSHHESNLPQDAHLPPKKRSPKRQSPKKSRSPREEWVGEVQASEVSETDDEKMRNLSAWLHGSMRGRASTPPSSSSSYSISEQLQQSHTSWTKGEGHRRSREGGKEEGEGSRREGGKEGEEIRRWRDRGGKEGEEMLKGKEEEWSRRRERGGKEEEEGHRGREGRERGGKRDEELTRGREREDEVRGESEFEFDASDLEDLSITGLTLTNTSLPEEMHTPGDEDF